MSDVKAICCLKIQVISTAYTPLGDALGVLVLILFFLIAEVFSRKLSFLEKSCENTIENKIFINLDCNQY